VSDRIIELPRAVYATPEEVGRPGQGKTRFVPVVVTPSGPLLVIWRSHETIMADVNGDGHPIAANECVVLVSRNPLVTMRAEVDVNLWNHCDQAVVEW
jgi:hypothetical protein